jgi:hypothetical protein
MFREDDNNQQVRPDEVPDFKPTEMNTLSECMNKVVKDGYRDSFKVTKQGLCSQASERCYLPDQVRIINYFRFEGESDPADNAIMYVIETNDGLKGILTDAYGPYSDTHVTKFITDVEEMNKKTEKSGYTVPKREP